MNIGVCELVPLSGPGIPPNQQLPLCACQTGQVPPQCAVNYLIALGGPDLIPLRWMCFSFYIIPLVLSIVVIAQHAYFASKYKLTNTNISKLIGAILVFLSAFFGLLSQGINPLGVVYGYPDASDVIGQLLLINGQFIFLTTCVAINTANWARVGLSAVSPAYRSLDGWPIFVKIGVWFIAISTTAIGIGLACATVIYPRFSEFLFLSAAIILVLTISSLISGIFVLLTIKNIETADPLLLRNTAAQLVSVCTLESILAGVILFVAYVGVDEVFAQTLTVEEIYGIGVILFTVLNALFQVLLLVQFRIAQWQLKEVALTRQNTATGFNSSARNQAASYNDEAVSASSINEDHKVSEKTKPVEVSTGVLEL